MSYMEFWARAFLVYMEGRAVDHAANLADDALEIFKQRFAAESEAPQVAREIKERIAASDAPEWAKPE